MKRIVPTPPEHELAQLVQRFDRWRAHRTTRAERIPSALWEQAVALTAMLSISRVAKCLRVSWRDLHKHSTPPPAAPAVEPSPAPLGFVEVPTASAWTLPPTSTEVELHRSDGARLWIHSHAPQCPLMALVRTFLETPGCSS